MEGRTLLQPGETASPPPAKKLLLPVVELLQTKLTDPELTLEGLGSMVGVSDAYLRRIFKKQYGVSPAVYLTGERLRLAKRLLLDDRERSVAEISAEVGYRDPLYFSRLFRQQVGISPSQYRKSHMTELY